MTNQTEEPTEPAPAPRDGVRSSSIVAAGILSSRIVGLVREAAFGAYFGTTEYADVFRAGLRMPNVLQVLLGEGTLSASFIPVYSELLHEGKKEEAGKTAGAIFGLLMLAAGVLSLIGILLAPLLVTVLAPGFAGERRTLTIEVVRIIFPMTGTLVLSAWALGILNSHRKFFLPYFAPVLWNVAIIATLVFFGRGMDLSDLVVALAWGALVGGFLQLLVQLPTVLKLERNLRISFSTRLASVRDVLRNTGPTVMGRGVVQVSSYIDMFLASLLAAGAVGIIGYAQTLYILPVSLFGMSVAAAELPELARKRSSPVEELRLRANSGLERIAFFVIPSFVAFILLGDAIVAALYQRGEFERQDTLLVYFTLAAFSIGLVASTGTRLFSSTFFALRDTKTPARFAIIRVVVAAILGMTLMIQFEPIPRLGIPAGIFSDVTLNGETLGAVGLAAGSGVAAWIEWILLRRRLKAAIGPVGAGGGKVARMIVSALLGAAAGWGVRYLIDVDPLIDAIFIFGAYGIVYFAAASILGLPEAVAVRNRLKRIVRR